MIEENSLVLVEVLERNLHDRGESLVLVEVVERQLDDPGE